ETTDEEICAKLSFLDRNNNPIPIPEGIFCKDITDPKHSKPKNPMTGCEFFLITHPNKYMTSERQRISEELVMEFAQYLNENDSDYNESDYHSDFEIKDE
ncbi:25709_t:CDS:2, partial [Racocetra persica]